MQTSIHTDKLAFGFFGYIRNISEVSVDILINVSTEQNCSKFMEMLRKLPRNDKRRIDMLKILYNCNRHNER